MQDIEKDPLLTKESEVNPVSNKQADYQLNTDGVLLEKVGDAKSPTQTDKDPKEEKSIAD